MSIPLANLHKIQCNIDSEPFLFDKKLEKGKHSILGNMEASCSFLGIGGVRCGESRGLQEIACLFDCKEDIKGHLSFCHLSKLNLMEYELIAFRAGMFQLKEDHFKKTFICPSHRHNLGRFWRSLRSCQYPIHSGPARKCEGRHVFNVALSEAVFTLYGKLIQVGSRKYCGTSLLVIYKPSKRALIITSALINNYN